MSVKQVTTLSPGLVGVYPRLIYISTNNTLAQVTTTGFLNAYNALSPGEMQDGDMALVVTRTTPSAADADSGFLQVNFSSGNWSLIQTNSPGSVVLPTIANHIATYTNTTGGLSEDPATAISGGNIQAGLSGTAGTLASFPGTALKGSLVLQATANSGNTITVVTNAAMGQASTITIPDPGVASASFVLSDGSTQHITTGNFQVDQGNLIAGSSGHAGHLESFPSTAANGKFMFTAIDAGGAFNTTVSNSIMGQSSTVSIPDPGSTTANFILSKNATTQQITVGNLQVTAGSLISGISTGGFVGKIQLFPTTTTTGSLTIQATPAGGNFASTITNAAFGQAVAFTIPDPGAASANFIISASGAGQSMSGGLTLSTGNLAVTVGNVTAGSSGNAGTLTSFPTTAANGSLIISALNAGGAFTTTIRNSVMAQSTVYSMGDIGAATGGIVVATAAIRMKSVPAGAYAGGSATATITDAFCTSGSTVVANWNTSANAVSIQKVTPGNGSFVVLSSGDPGVSTLNYIITK